MFPKVRYFFKFLQYILFSRHSKGHGIHSPFVYNIVSRVFQDKRVDDHLKQVLNIHRKYKNSSAPLVFEEMGAGSHTKPHRIPLIKAITKQNHSLVSTTVGKNIRNSSVSRKYGSLLYRLVKHFKPGHLLEIGTSLGISTLYIAQGAPGSDFITLEGVKEKRKIAKKLAGELKLENIHFMSGDFDLELPKILRQTKRFDFIFFDGNHTRNATLNYFYACLENVHPESVFVFDDIHWSKEMEEAWDAIKMHPRVRVSIDLFQAGIVFFKKEITQGHYTIKF
ncbi:MAG: class I SAM-dependent methyltransferase [Bacteroidales bacterium]|jgi:predicted O-methyltransferase YrrM|nr:class I SAM-dependent methyltransferase [Bacteroidales bacterium]